MPSVSVTKTHCVPTLSSFPVVELFVNSLGVQILDNTYCFHSCLKKITCFAVENRFNFIFCKLEVGIPKGKSLLCSFHYLGLQT